MGLFVVAVSIVLYQSAHWQDAFLSNILCCFALALDVLTLIAVGWAIRIGLKTIGLTVLASMIVAFVVAITLGLWWVLFAPFVLLIILLNSKIQG